MIRNPRTINAVFFNSAIIGLFTLALFYKVGDLGKYKQAEFIWCQEESKNMGAWFVVEDSINFALSHDDFVHKTVKYIGRKISASPAVGYLKVHNKEQEHIINSIFG